jgi:two-component system nitrate/nitrite response regulator NarL
MIVTVVCDEHLLFGEAFADALRANGVRVVVTAHPREAMAAFAIHPVTHLVLDVRFTAACGIRATREIRSGWPETRIVCLGAEEASVVRSCIEAGADLVLSKRQSLGELVDSVLRTPITRPAAARLVTTGSTVHPGTSQVSSEPLAARFLTNRERDVLRLLASAASTREIAKELGISVATARGYIQSAFIKLGVHSRVEAATYAVRNLLVGSRGGVTAARWPPGQGNSATTDARSEARRYPSSRTTSVVAVAGPPLYSPSST